MFVNPAFIGLFICSVLVSSVTLYGSGVGISIIRSWNITSGSEKQLRLERRTYLVSTVVTYVMACQILSLFLFIATADQLHSLFTGAMCAAGTLNANSYGYMTLVMKMVTVILAGVWLIVNHLDNRAPDYPLIRFKYQFLLLVTVLVVIESVLQVLYLVRLDPEIITSCCGALFSEDANTIMGELAHLEPLAAEIGYYLVLVITLCLGIHLCRSGKGAILFSLSSMLLFFISLAAIISFISLYYYELPTHHCPFCILQGEYHFIGYFLYLALFGAAIAGLGIGVVNPFRKTGSLQEIVPAMQRKLCFAAMAGHVLFGLISTYQVLFSNFRLQGY